MKINANKKEGRPISMDNSKKSPIIYISYNMNNP